MEDTRLVHTNVCMTLEQHIGDVDDHMVECSRTLNAKTRNIIAKFGGSSRDTSQFWHVPATL